MRKAIGLILGIVMLVSIIVSFSVAAASGVQIDNISETISRQYYGSSLCVSSSVNARNLSSSYTAYAQTRLYRDGALDCTGAERSLTIYWTNVASGWSIYDSSKSYSGKVYGRVLQSRPWDYYDTWYS